MFTGCGMCSNQRLRLIICLVCCIICAAKAEEINQKPWRIGNFTFLEKPNSNFMVHYLHDLVDIKCRTNNASAKTTLFVKGHFTEKKNIKDSRLFNATLRRRHQDFTFLANPSQSHQLFLCKAQLGNRTIWGHRGTMLARPEKRMVPVQLEPNVTSVTLEKSMNYEISCKAPGKGLSSSLSYLKWVKGNTTGKQHGVDERMVHRRNTGLLDIEVIRFSNVNKSFEGVYTCARQVGIGPYTSASFELLVKDAEPPFVVLRPNVSQLLVADYKKLVVIDCLVRTASPKPTVSWFKGSKKLQSCSNSMNCSLQITHVKSALDSGTYTCVATNTEGSHSASVFLNITALPNTKTEFVSPKSILKSNTKIVAIAVSCSAMAILIVIFVAYCYNRGMKKKYERYLMPFDNFVLDNNRSLNDQGERLPYDPMWEFPRKKLDLLEPIGRGAFGEVWLAKAQGILEFQAEVGRRSPAKIKNMSRAFSFSKYYHNAKLSKDTNQTTVAVKTLKSNAPDSDYKDLASELKILIHIGEHQNIVNLLGACTRGGKLLVILEYCLFGDLSKFLRSKRDIFEPSWTKNDICFEHSCTYFDLANFTYQIAKGMEYLSSKKCVHRDLAARNVLVSKDHNQDYVVKVADFGMARDIYKKGIYTKESTSVLPLKWTAPESLADSVYTIQSDVWSFGVVVWEIFTLGGSPYPGISTDRFLAYLKADKRMEKPECCPDSLYALMLSCWDNKPECRPTFSKLVQLVFDIIANTADSNTVYLRLESGEGENECRSHLIDADASVTTRPEESTIDSDGSTVDSDDPSGPTYHGYENLAVSWKKKKSAATDQDQYIELNGTAVPGGIFDCSKKLPFLADFDYKKKIWFEKERFRFEKEDLGIERELAPSRHSQIATQGQSKRDEIGNKTAQLKIL
eukprot:gene7461-8284_t